MKRISKKFWALPAAALALVLTAASASAVPTLIVDFGDDGFDPLVDKTFTDLSGMVTTGGFLASGDLTITATGTTKPAVGSETSPKLASVALSIGGSGTVGLYFFDTGYGPSGGGLTASFALTSLGIEGETTYATYADQANSAFSLFTGTGTGAITVQTLTDVPLSALTAYGAIPFDTAGPYSLLQKIVITQEGGATGLTANLTVPDGGATAALLGCSFLGLAYVRNRFSFLKA